MTIVCTNWDRNDPTKFQIGELVWTGDIDENDMGEDENGVPLEPTYTLYCEHMTDINIVSVGIEVMLEWLTAHGIEIFERGVPLEELTNG